MTMVKRIGVFTSGSDAPGMNAALRAVVRLSISRSFDVFMITEGYKGLVEGGDYFHAAEWNSVTDIIQYSGTIIGSSGCADFLTPEGRLKAVENLASYGITDLVCIGGNDSLNALHVLWKDWEDLSKQLVERGKMDVVHPRINIVGVPSSIYNDFCGSDMTIGSDSALNRIIESIDAVATTAYSHQRSFVIEVMGRWGGYLALIAAIAGEADWLFIREWPMPVEWPDLLSRKLKESKHFGQRVHIIICSQGAVDTTGKPISSEEVMKVMRDLGHDTRATVLGHVQRGGRPSAFDRMLGCRMGAEAVLALLDARKNPSEEPVAITLDGNALVRRPLEQCLKQNNEIRVALENCDWKRALELRGTSFRRNLLAYALLNKIHPPVDKENLSGGHQFNFAVMNVGSPACGMNPSVRVFVRMGLYYGCKVYAITDSFNGLIEGKFKEMSWHSVDSWSRHGGSYLGSQKSLPSINFSAVAKQLALFKIDALLLVGGFDAFHACLQLEEQRPNFKEFRIPIAVLPCTISNNVPGTNFTIGSDSALNVICSMVDKLKQSALGTKKRVFIVETMGGYCGYLATLSALASGADNAYIYEESFSVDDMKGDIRAIAEKMSRGIERYIVTRAEYANKNYTAEFMLQFFSEEGKGEFTTRVNVFGHAQQGGRPSPFDRLLSTRMAVHITQVLVNMARSVSNSDGHVHASEPDTAVLLGIGKHHSQLIPVTQLKDKANFELRLAHDEWWLKLRPLLRVLAAHECEYTTSA